MRISEILEQEDRSLSFEFFPPKTEEGNQRLFDTIQELAKFKPSFVSVTYGAGGSAKENTRQVVERILQETPLTPMPHLTCVGQTEGELRIILRHYRELGIENILALRGDRPREMTDSVAKQVFCTAKDLVRLVASHRTFSIGVAVYPEGHIQAPSLSSDLYYTKQKIDAGADFAITQMFFDNRYYYDYVDRARTLGIHIPIIPGIMPVVDIQKISQFCETCGVTMPSALVSRMEKAASLEEMTEIGVDFTTRQVEDLWRNGVRYFHFYTLNRADTVSNIMRNLSYWGQVGETRGVGVIK
jgi:methylenetetrahydrofolate reductase (NADPH)